MTSNHSDVDDLIAALRDDLPSDRDQERIRKRLAGVGLFVGASAASLGAQAARLEAQGQAIWSVTPKSTVLGKLLGLSATTKAVLVTAVLGGSAAGLPRILESRSLRTEEPSSAQAPAAERALVPESKAMTPEVPSPQENQATAQREPLALTPSRPKRLVPTVVPRAVKSVQASDLAEETRLMERAIAANQRGDRAEAARYLELHAEQFPNGALSPERQRLRARL